MKEQRKLQQTLAEDVTRLVHSDEDLQLAMKASNILFGNSTTEDLQSLDEETLLTVFEGVPQTTIAKHAYQSCPSVTDLLSDVSNKIVFPSKGEARRMIKAGGVSINKKKLADENATPDFELLQGKYLLAQKGKKNYYLLVIE